MLFKVLDGALVLFRGVEAAERAEVAAAFGLRIDLAGIDSVLSRFKFAYHIQVLR